MTKDEQLDALRIENVRLIDENTALKAQLALTWEGLVTSVCWNYPHGPHGCGGNNKQGDGTVCTFCVPKRKDKEGAGMTDELTDERLAELERLEKAATRGPWGYHDPTNDMVTSGKDASGAYIYIGEMWEEHDEALIVAARNALPSLIAEVRRLRARERARLDWMKGSTHWDGCYQAHPDCAIEEVERLRGVLTAADEKKYRDEVEQLRAQNDKLHQDWVDKAAEMITLRADLSKAELWAATWKAAAKRYRKMNIVQRSNVKVAREAMVEAQDLAERLRTKNAKLRAVASSGATLIRSLQTALEAQYDPEHPIRISRREMMDLPLETRRRVMERMAEQFMAQNVGQSDATSDTLDAGNYVQNVDAATSGRTQDDDLDGESCARCGWCGQPMTHVRPGKWQCDNDECSYKRDDAQAGGEE